MAVPSLVAGLAFTALAGGGVALYVQNKNLIERIDELKVTSAKAAERSSAPSSGAPALQGGGGVASRNDVDEVRRQLGQVAERVTAQEKRTAVAAVPGAPGLAGGTAAGRFEGPAFEESVRKVLAAVHAEPEFKQQVAEAAGKPGLDKKPTFGALSKYLALDAAQETDFRQDLQDAQGELMALLAEERPDGRVLLKEIGEMDALPEGDPKRAQVFLDLFKLKIPGTEQTYIEKVFALATAFRTKANGYLRPEQRERFAGTEIDLFGVKMQ